MVEFTPTTPDVIQMIADDMRDADKAEVWASHHHTPIEALIGSCNQPGFSTVAWLGGKPCAMFGVVVCDILSGTGSPWLLGTNGIVNNYREFLKHSQQVVDDMIRVCPNLSNHVHADNKLSMRWLKWLGFTFEGAAPYGIEGEMFHRFYIRS